MPYNTADHNQLSEDQVRKLYEHFVFSINATLINGLILVFILRHQVPHKNLVIWLVLTILVSIGRMVLFWCHRHYAWKNSTPEKWRVWFIALLFVAGLLWGSSGIFLFPEKSIGHQAFMAFVTGGMVAGAAGTYTSIFSAFLLYSFPALLPIIVQLFLFGTEIHIAMATMLLLYLCIISLTALRIHKDLLSQLSLKYEKNELVADLQQEIAQRKAAQKDLRQQKAYVEEIVTQRTAELKNANLRLRAIINYAPLIIWVIDKEGVLTFCDGKGLEKFGYDAGQILHQSVFELLSEYNDFIESTRQVLAGEFVSNTIEFGNSAFEIRYQPMKNTDNHLSGAIGVALDVTQQIQAKAAVRKSEDKYRELVENINDVLFVVDQYGVITYISPVVESVLGYRGDELTGRLLFDFVFAQDLDRLRTGFAAALESSGKTAEYRFWSKSGELKWFRSSSRPIVEEGRTVGIQGVLVDITRSKRLEDQLQRAQKMEALGTMAGGVAHDLNNILSGIVSYPELLLLELPLESPLRRPLATIKKSGENAAAIVQDLLTLARRGVSTVELLNLNQIVQECIDSPEIRSLKEFYSGTRINTQLQPDLFNVYGSSVHILKSLGNLITNAAEAMPKGGCVDISTINRYVDKIVTGFDTVEEGEYVVLSVADSGIGISDNDRTRIFEPFYTKKIMGRSGSGLGMAVVWGTVKDHKGYIDIQSQVGSGTRFDLYFPATRDQIQTENRRHQLSDCMGNGQFVLVVDDMPLQREVATNMLQRLGYRFKAVASGEEAVDFCRSHSVDLIVLDMIMTPGMDGYETYRRIVDIHPGQKAIIASGFSESDQVRKALALGAGPYLKKPYTLTALGMALKDALA